MKRLVALLVATFVFGAVVAPPAEAHRRRTRKKKVVNCAKIRNRTQRARCYRNQRPKPRPNLRWVTTRDLTAYAGLGTWVDAYDFSREFGNPSVTPDHVDVMANEGVRTIYLQASKDDSRSRGDLLSPDLLGEFLYRAHARGIRVVGWYLPKFYDDGDVRRMNAIRNFEAHGQKFDGVALDIEWRNDVPDHAERSRRLVDLSRKLRESSGGEALGAIVMPPVVTDVINPNFWPGFPWAEISTLYDVWMPMGYWTNRTQESGWRDAYRYTYENIRLLREDLANSEARVHALGGVGNRATLGDYEGFIRAAFDQRSIGASSYDFNTTSRDAWGTLRGAPY